MDGDIWIEFRGKRVSESNYGHDYPEDFRYILRKYAPKKTGNILEWGSGLTTLITQSMLDEIGARHFTSIENDKEFWQAMSQRVTDRRVDLLLRELIGATQGQDDIGDNYTSYPLHACQTYDLIFIDGRRRLECAFVAALIAHQKTVVFMHDFRRSRYQAILGLYEIIEEPRQFRVMRLRPSVHKALSIGRKLSSDYFSDLYRRSFPRFAPGEPRPPSLPAKEMLAAECPVREPS
jgi:predicted O-methyltransferase YrrM